MHYSRAKRSRSVVRTSVVRGRLRFESLLLRLTAAFVNTPSRIDQQSELWLQKLATFIGVERSSFWELRAGGRGTQCLYFYRAPGEAAPPLDLMSAEQYPWLTEQYQRGNVVSWSRIPDDIPASAVAERAHALQIGAKSALSIPIAAASSIWILTFVSTNKYRKWTDATIRRLRLVNQLFTNAMLRERAENSLRSSDERFRGAFEHSAIGIALVSLEGRWLATNTALEGMLGYTEAELRATTFQALTHPHDLAANMELRRRALAGEITHFEVEKRYVHKDGGIVPALLTTSLVRDAEGRPHYFISQVQDFSERARAQSEIDRLRFELTHSGRAALMGHLTASLAHELLQPITAMLANAEALQHLVAAESLGSGRFSEYLDDIIDSGHRAAAVIARVRALLRKERTPYNLLDLNQIVESVTSMMRSDLISRSVCLTLRLDPSGPEVRGDPIELQQIVLNLLLNGAEAMRDVTVTERVLTVSTQRRAGQVELAVSDQGTGIDPQKIPRMFQPFFSTKSDGLGMGLAICLEIARSHGGRLWAENNRSAGMTLHLILPEAHVVPSRNLKLVEEAASAAAAGDAS